MRLPIVVRIVFAAAVAVTLTNLLRISRSSRDDWRLTDPPFSRQTPSRQNRFDTRETISKRTSNATLANPCGERIIAATDDDSFCGTHELPVTPYSVPAHCWPRVVLLASFPTSGNGLVHHTFENLTGLVAFAMYERRGRLGFVAATEENQQAISLFYDEDYVCLASNNDNNDALTIAFKGRVALTKTHLPGNSQHEVVAAKLSSTKGQQQGEMGGGISAVVRLARNPGDHVLRNLFRRKVKSCHDDDCFFREARVLCDSLEGQARGWSRFHEFWSDNIPSVPQIVLHYEEVSRPDTAPGVFRRFLEFIGEKERYPLEEKVKAIVSEPTYAQGSLVAQVCGVSTARTINAITREESEKLGYEFNNETGIWTLT